MSEKPQHYTPQYINSQGTRNPFSPGFGLGQPAAGPTYIIRQKSILISYLLWIFLGIFGLHKLYLRQPGMFIFYLLLHGLGWLTAPIIIGYLFWALLGLLLVIDLFTIPIRVSLINARANRRIY
ncbi:MAG: TM2 domain-containing protein [Rothia sp. (in: high G+C Gram-positive bacteria)]|nr:TM2 domain-containing protein [Rothia sp. (in: high G+C Gram-positive bacteria)]